MKLLMLILLALKYPTASSGTSLSIRWVSPPSPPPPQQPSTGGAVVTLFGVMLLRTKSLETTSVA